MKCELMHERGYKKKMIPRSCDINDQNLSNALNDNRIMNKYRIRLLMVHILTTKLCDQLKYFFISQSVTHTFCVPHI